MKKTYIEIKSYVHKYPWIFYYFIISALSSFFLKIYIESKTFVNPIEPSWILVHTLVSGALFFFWILILTLVLKHIVDSYLHIEDKEYVYYPAKWFGVWVILNLISVFMYFKMVFVVSASFFVGNDSIHVARLMNSVFLLFVNVVLFGLYRRKQ